MELLPQIRNQRPDGAALATQELIALYPNMQVRRNEVGLLEIYPDVSKPDVAIVLKPKFERKGKAIDDQLRIELLIGIFNAGGMTINTWEGTLTQSDLLYLPSDQLATLALSGSDLYQSQLRHLISEQEAPAASNDMDKGEYVKKFTKENPTLERDSKMARLGELGELFHINNALQNYFKRLEEG